MGRSGGARESRVAGEGRRSHATRAARQPGPAARHATRPQPPRPPHLVADVDSVGEALPVTEHQQLLGHRRVALAPIAHERVLQLEAGLLQAGAARLADQRHGAEQLEHAGLLAHRALQARAGRHQARQRQRGVGRGGPVGGVQRVEAGAARLQRHLESEGKGRGRDGGRRAVRAPVTREGDARGEAGRSRSSLPARQRGVAAGGRGCRGGGRSWAGGSRLAPSRWALAAAWRWRAAPPARVPNHAPSSPAPAAHLRLGQRRRQLQVGLPGDQRVQQQAVAWVGAGGARLDLRGRLRVGGWAEGAGA